MQLEIKWMFRKDLADVLEIEQFSFLSPWSEDDFCRNMRKQNCIGLSVKPKHDNRIIGYAIYELHDTRFNIIRMAVSYQWRLLGVGRGIIESFHSRLRPESRNRITMEVPETNLDAQLFLRTVGFKAVRVLHDRYEDSDEDSYLMQYRLNQPAMTRIAV